MMTMLSENILSVAIKTIAGVCDGAKDDDGVGFAAPDVGRGHRLASKDFDLWTGEDKSWAYETLRKYSKQLANHGLTYAEFPKPKDESLGKVLTNGENLFITFRYSADLVNSIKETITQKYRRYVSVPEKGWEVRPTAEAIAQVQKLEWLSWTQSAVELAKNPQQDVAKSSSKTAAANTLFIEGDRFIIEFAYDANIITAIRHNVPGAAWDKVRKNQWYCTVNASNAKGLMDFAEAMPSFVWNSEAKATAERLINEAKMNFALSTSKSADLFEISGVMGTPYPFQNAGVLYGVINKTCIIGDEPGLGKTVQGLLIAYQTQSWPTMVTCPNSVTANWKKEILAWLPLGIDQVVIATNRTTQEELDNALIVIVAHDHLADGMVEVKPS